MTVSKLILPAFLLVSLAGFNACTSNEVGDSKDVAQDKIYQQYSVGYTEGDEKVNVYAQFRFAGRNGTTLVLNKPSQLSFDGKPIGVDSSKASGAYYQLYEPVSGFYGKHHFVFTDINSRKFDNDFTFDNFKLVNIPAAAVSKKQALDLGFETAALQADDYIEVSTNGSDSSFTVRHDAKDGANKLSIPAKELMRQKGKELRLEAILYRKVPLQQNTAEGGTLDIRYTLRPVTIRLAE